MGRGYRKKRIGKVVSDKMNKGVVIEVERRFIEPRYKKIVRRKKRFKAHDEKNECKTGDTVLIMETRPLSRDKKWRVVNILGRAKDLVKKHIEEESEKA